MLIGFDGSRAFTKNKTGTENYSFQLLKNLSKIDKKNNYLVYLRPGVEVAEEWPDNFKFQILNFKFLWTQAGLAKETFLSPIDLLFVPAHTLPLIYKKGLKTVVTVHDLGSEYLPKMHKLKQRLYLSFMQNHQLKTATKIIAVSEATKKDLVEKIGLYEKKIEVVYEGFDNKMFDPKGDIKDNSLNKYGIEEDSYFKKVGGYFLFVGTVQPRKNLERIIKAFAKLDGDQKLVIAGSKGWLSEGIYELPKKLGIKERVKFLGYVPDKDLPSLYRGAKALIFASLFEGFGLPILESQACGCPVITSNISSMKEIAGKGAILVNPYDIEAIYHAMIEVGDKKVKEKLIKSGFENTKRFSWENCAENTLKVFEETGKV